VHSLRFREKQSSAFRKKRKNAFPARETLIPLPVLGAFVVSTESEGRPVAGGEAAVCSANTPVTRGALCLCVWISESFPFEAVLLLFYTAGPQQVATYL